MLALLLFLSSASSLVNAHWCSNCGFRFRFPQQKIRNQFHFVQQQPQFRPQFSSFMAPKQKILNIYGQDAGMFGSMIGKSIADRINQEKMSSQLAHLQFSSQSQYSYPPSPPPTYPTNPPTLSTLDFMSSPTPSASSSSSPSSPPIQTPQSLTYTHPPSPSPSWQSPSTHPPEELPTVQQSMGISAPPPSGYGSLVPGMLPPPSAEQIGYDPIRKIDLTSCSYCPKGRARRFKGDHPPKQ